MVYEKNILFTISFVKKFFRIKDIKTMTMPQRFISYIRLLKLHITAILTMTKQIYL